MRKLLNFLLGFMLGVLIGAAIAMLLAPEPGEATRGQIQQRVQEVIDEGKRAAAERRAELESASHLDQLDASQTAGWALA